MAMHGDRIFCVKSGQPFENDDDAENYGENQDYESDWGEDDYECGPLRTSEEDEFKPCSDGWYWQHRRVHPSDERSLGQAFGPLQGPFETEDEAKSHKVKHPELGIARLGP